MTTSSNILLTEPPSRYHKSSIKQPYTTKAFSPSQVEPFDPPIQRMSQKLLLPQKIYLSKDSHAYLENSFLQDFSTNLMYQKLRKQTTSAMVQGSRILVQNQISGLQKRPSIVIRSFDIVETVYEEGDKENRISPTLQYKGRAHQESSLQSQLVSKPDFCDPIDLRPKQDSLESLLHSPESPLEKSTVKLKYQKAFEMTVPKELLKLQQQMKRLEA